MTIGASDTDPRLSLDNEPPALVEVDEEPLVGVMPAGPSPLLVGSVLAVAAVGLFLTLNARRLEHGAPSLTAPKANAVLSAPEPPLVLASVQAAPDLTSPLLAGVSAVPAPVAAAPTPRTAAAIFPTTATTPKVDPLIRRRAPTVVVDLDYAARGSAPAGFGGEPRTQGAAQRSSAVGGAAGAAGAVATLATQDGAQGAGAPRLNSDEAFAARVGDSASPDRAVASSMSDLGTVVPQGAMIPAVLETAINSDLPGYTRAVVSRDVRSFDGRNVLIPRGSRLIGQYKSAVAQGQSRAFIIWTRVTRPDGVSVQIGSPGTDALGRGGLEGEVDRHFFSRFGGSILLSVLNGAVNALGGAPSTQIAIGSPGAAASAAASVTQGDNVPPTIKIPQGEAIRIFVARDLEFAAVGPSR